MENKKWISITLILSGVCLWVLYIFEQEMSNFGIYTLVNYNIHEILTIVPYICILTTIILIVVLAKVIVKNKNIKSNFVIVTLLIALFIVQVNYVVSQSSMISTATIARVVSIDPQREEITINQGTGDIVLNCPMTIFNLLEVDKEYSITYQQGENTSEKGKIHLIQIIEN